MNFGIFLLILWFAESLLTSNINNTKDDSCHVCTLSYLRRKRDHSEYTRWYTDLESTQEFIVKVLEDDLPSTKKAIAAVNIEPLTKAHEKIIIGGAAITSPSTELTLDSKEYTRFVPPTNVSVTKVDGKVVLSPIKAFSNVILPIRPKGIEIKHGSGRQSLRDDSPPAGPQFLPRSKTFVTRQYAPIAPVSFTRLNTIGPLTPRTVDNFILRKTTVRPTRTLSYSDIILPTRTSKFVNIFTFQYSSELLDILKLSQSSELPPMDIHRTSSMTFEKQKNYKESRKFYIHGEDSLKKTDSTNKSFGKENELFYNDLFYVDEEDNDTTKTKENTTDNEDNAYILNNTPENIIEPENAGNDTEKDDLDKNDEDEDELNTSTTKTTVYINGVTSLKVQQKNKTSTETKLFCSVLRSNPLSFSAPLSLHEIVIQLKRWAEESPIAKWQDITNGNYTDMENPIYMMIVDDPSSGQIVSAKKTVMIIAGIQGRDHHAVSAAMYVLYQLIERSEARSDLLSKFRFWIIPVFNPDGYDYSMKFPHRRDWTKNLHQSWDSCKGRDSCRACQEFGLRCTIQPCYGVNLDRNFEYQWIPPDELRAEHPCGTLYAGLRQLSEMETLALTHFLHEQRTPIYTFISFKEGDVLGILYPYSHTNKRRAFDHVHRQRASRAASAAYSISGRPYVAGQTSEFLPLYAGGIEDWVDGHLGIDNTYTVMMFRPNDAQNSKLATERVVHEAYAAIDTLLLQSIEPSGLPQVTLTRAKASLSPLSPKTYALMIIVFIQYM